MNASVIWKGKMGFTGSADSGFSLPLDTSIESGGDDQGFRPMELLLVGLAGCTSMDVLSILHKKQQQVTGFEVKVKGERATDHPKVFTQIVVEYIVTGIAISTAGVERAVELSETQYCSAYGMLSKAAKIEHKITILEA